MQSRAWMPTKGNVLSASASSVRRRPPDSAEGSLDGRGHLVLRCFIKVYRQSINFEVLVLPDNGATGYAFMDPSLAQTLNCPQTRLAVPRILQTFDGSESISGRITHTASAILTVGDHSELTRFFVTKLGEFPVIVGLPWLQRHNPLIDWSNSTLTLGSDYCLSHCLAAKRPYTVHMFTPDPLVPAPSPAKETKPAIDISMIGAIPFVRQARKRQTDVFTIRYQDVERALAETENPIALRKAVTKEDVAKALKQSLTRTPAPCCPKSTTNS